MSAVQQPAHPIGQLIAVCRLGDVVGGAGLLVVVGDDGAHELGGVPAGAAAQDVHTWRIGVFVLGFCCSALVHQMIPRPRALSQSVRCPVIERFRDSLDVPP